MSHAMQRNFVDNLKWALPQYFDRKDVLDVGSQDVNGSNRDFFKASRYTGLDRVSGRNVDVVCGIEEFDHAAGYDVIICTEMLEHDPLWKAALARMVWLLRSGGLLILTCASTGRSEHGFEYGVGGYYRNLTEAEIRDELEVEKIFGQSEFINERSHHDLYFWGIKR